MRHLEALPSSGVGHHARVVLHFAQPEIHTLTLSLHSLSPHTLATHSQVPRVWRVCACVCVCVCVARE